jgi:AraC-like DNA-binding protein
MLPAPEYAMSGLAKSGVYHEAMATHRDYMLREAGIALLAASGGFECLVHDQLGGPFQIEPHHHDQVLQLDLVRACSGKVLVHGRWLRFEGSLLLVAYPRETHGYTLTPMDESSGVFHFKLPLARENTLVAEAALPRVARPPHDNDDLFAIAREAVDRCVRPHTPALPAVLELIRLLARWPTKGATDGTAAAPAEVDPAVEQAVTFIESRLDEPPSLGEIARQVGVSGRHLSRLFVESTGLTPHRYANARRLALAKTRLLGADRPIAAIGDELGFSSPATFTRWFRDETGLTPRDFRSDPTVF